MIATTDVPAGWWSAIENYNKSNDSDCILEAENRPSHLDLIRYPRSSNATDDSKDIGRRGQELSLCVVEAHPIHKDNGREEGERVYTRSCDEILECAIAESVRTVHKKLSMTYYRRSFQSTNMSMVSLIVG